MKRKLLALLLSVLLIFTTAACNAQQAASGTAPSDATGTDASVTDASGADTSGTDAVATPTAVEREEIPEAPLASLADNVVNSTDFTLFYLSNKSNMEYQAMMMGYADMEELWNQVEDGKTLREMLAEDTLRSVKEFAVFYRMAMEDSAQLTAEESAEAIGQVKNALAQFGDDEQAFLNAYGLTAAQLEIVQQRLMLANKYMNQLFDSIPVSDTELQAYYDENKETLDQVTVRHVLISCDDTMSQEDQAAALSKAEDVLAQIQGGADIGELAATHSEDPGSKDTQGEYTFGRNQMVPEFEEWAYSAQIGDQGMVKTSYGYHIMEMMGRTGLEEAKEQIEISLRNERFAQEYQAEYDLVDSPDWQVDQTLLDTLIA